MTEAMNRLIAGRQVQLALAVVLIAAVARWPYGYYEFLRWAVCGGSAYFASLAAREGRRWWVVAFVAIALLFNPIRPVHLQRENWEWIDVVAAIVFLCFLPSRATPPTLSSRQRHFGKLRGVAGVLVGKVLGALILVAIAWFLFGGRITYAVAECSHGATQCVSAIAVALGLVDMYDENGRCVGDGCNL